MRKLTAGLAVLGALAIVPGPSNAGQGLDWLATDSVRFVKNIPDAADGVGGRVVGGYLYVTSSKGLQIYDLSSPEDPQQVGSITVQMHWENEQVPTNGVLLGISSSDGCAAPDASKGAPDVGSNQRANCLSIYDVRDKSHPVWLTSVWGAGAHTNTCLLDCSYMWGSNGAVTDLTHVLDPGHPASVIGKWTEGLPIGGTHHQSEVSPGVVLTASQPVLLLSVRAEDGGSVTRPKLLAKGSNDDRRFIHSALWPRHGADKFALIGGETNGEVRCDLEATAAFMTWTRPTRKTLAMIDEYRLTSGTFTDGAPPVNHLGCSVHWYEEHPSFHDRGLVALGAYEHGTRFLHVDERGKIHEVGWFLPFDGSASAPHWGPDGKTLYVIDYQRGIDVIQWLGSTYVPGASPPAKVLNKRQQKPAREALPSNEVPGDVAPRVSAPAPVPPVFAPPAAVVPAPPGPSAPPNRSPREAALAVAAALLASATGLLSRRRRQAERECERRWIHPGGFAGDRPSDHREGIGPPCGKGFEVGAFESTT
jgi:hypothetical protein